MKRLGLAVALLCSGLFAPGVLASNGTPDVPTGQWLTAGHDAVIQVAPCGNGYCGRIAAMRITDLSAPEPVDWQGQPQCGLTIVQTTSVSNGDDGTVWQGVVLDPRNGVSHPALLSFDPSGALVLRGYLLIPLLGRSTVWTKYTGEILPHCHLPG